VKYAESTDYFIIREGANDWILALEGASSRGHLDIVKSYSREQRSRKKN